MSTAARLAIDWVEQGLVPDGVVRKGIRALCKQRLEAVAGDDCETAAEALESFLAHLRSAPVALVPEQANAQHYEVPEAFFGQVLGPRRKYSCCWWPAGVTDLEAAEEAALAVTCERADLTDGQRVLELGCGWGSLSLWMAARYPRARITAVSNSHSQRAYIEARAAATGLGNLRVVTADMNEFDPADRFDRVVSVEMFEHMRNWETLLRRIRAWLLPDGRFFMHIFCHREHPYLFEDRGDDDWMSRHFFTGGMMPSDALPLHFQGDLRLLRRWRWSGRHYERTANAWLARMDARRAVLMPVLAATYGEAQAATWWHRWRMFFMACAETFGYAGGNQWWVGHYLFERGDDGEQ